MQESLRIEDSFEKVFRLALLSIERNSQDGPIWYNIKIRNSLIGKGKDPVVRLALPGGKACAHEEKSGFAFGLHANLSRGCAYPSTLIIAGQLELSREVKVLLAQQSEQVSGPIGITSARIRRMNQVGDCNRRVIALSRAGHPSPLTDAPVLNLIGCQRGFYR